MLIDRAEKQGTSKNYQKCSSSSRGADMYEGTLSTAGSKLGTFGNF